MFAILAQSSFRRVATRSNSVRAETKIMIEESVYQQRTGRLLDMGIPEPFAAQKVYSWLDPELYKAKRPFKLAPGSFAASAPGFTLTLGYSGRGARRRT